jgi:hypothetical protein
MVTCPDCEGRGCFDGGPDAMDDRQCSVCGGTGEVSEDIAHLKSVESIAGGWVLAALIILVVGIGFTFWLLWGVGAAAAIPFGLPTAAVFIVFSSGPLTRAISDWWVNRSHVR